MWKLCLVLQGELFISVFIGTVHIAVSHSISSHVSVCYCPIYLSASSCLNGGGQLHTLTTHDTSSGATNMNTIKSQQQQLQQLTSQYKGERSNESVEYNRYVKSLYSTWLADTQPYSNSSRTVLHTSYHTVEKQVVSNPLSIKW